MSPAWFEAIPGHLTALLTAHLPARCEVCRTWPARPVCDSCAQRFATPVARCIRCACRLPQGLSTAGQGPTTCTECLRAPPPLDACHAALSYAFPWPDLIARFKFQGEPGWARTFAAIMRAVPGVAQVLQAADRVLPLPLGPRRLAERGYNQAHELARRLAPGREDARSLLRARDTAPQSTLGHDDRLANVRSAFVVDPSRAAALRGAHLLLVDDVMTSGATLAAAAQALRRAGAARVTALVLARTDD
jgi:ComF family protein